LFNNQIVEVVGTKIPYICVKIILVETPWCDWIYLNIQVVKGNVITKWWLDNTLNFIFKLYKSNKFVA
jgi:hypothetical protein